MPTFIRRLAFCVVAAISSSAAAVDAPPLAFPEHGFAIGALQGRSDTEMQQVVMLMLPQTDGFAANVNVQVQPFAGSLDEYMKVSQDQFKQLGLQVIAQTRDKGGITFEYKGEMQGRPLHWYARVLARKGRVYLATATATDKQWPVVSAQLKKSVDGLRLLP